MKEVAAVMIILAFAGAKATRGWEIEAPLLEKPSGLIYVRSSNGTSVGYIRCRQQEPAYTGPLTDISGCLAGLPPGDYLSVVHESENYNGPCDSAGPFMNPSHDDDPFAIWSPFSMITVEDKTHKVRATPKGISFDRSSKMYLPGKLVLFYHLPRNSPIWINGISETNNLPPAAACGFLVDETPNTVPEDGLIP